MALCYGRGTARFVSIEKLAIDNDLGIHPRSSQLLILNDRTAYHFLFVDSRIIRPVSDHFRFWHAHFWDVTYQKIFNTEISNLK